jgi:hypothetical protein
VCTGFWWGNLKERDHLEDPGMDGRIILRGMSMKSGRGGGGGKDWIELSQDGERCLTLFNSIINLRVP